MKLIILAAGYATRLESLTRNRSKSLLEIGGKKILDRILEKTSSVNQISHIYVVTNAKFFKDFNEWLKSSKFKNKITILNDGTVSNETRLGAIRDIEFAVTKGAIDDDVMVVAGDNLFDFELTRFVEFAKAHPSCLSVALHDIGDINAAKKFGVVAIDKDNKVIDFEEKPPKPKSTLISTGIYYFPKNKLPLIEEYVKMRDKLDAPGYYVRWMASNDKVYGFTFQDDWYDIGNIDSYKKADGEYFKKERK
jgi:glucose-1-phosphate thymidylyltransferase